MESLHPLALKIIAGLALLYFGLGLFNIHWLLRIRILTALSCGALLVSVLGWKMVRPEDPLGAITLFNGEITTIEVAILFLLGIAAAVTATLICRPLGKYLAPVAAPAGIGVLALASGTMSQILLTNDTLAQRNAVYGFLRWELLLWLGICAAGYLACLATSKITGTKIMNLEKNIENSPLPNKWVNMLIAAAISAAVIYFTIGIFAQDIRQIDDKLGFVVGQPGNRQIPFGVFVSAGLAAFIVKHFMKSHYLPVIAGAAGLYIVMFSQFIDSETLQYMVKSWSIYFYPKSIYAILPIEFASFSILGAISGYWMSIYFSQSKNQELSDNPASEK